MFEFVLWGSTGLLLAALFVHWWRQDARQRRETALFRRWRNATAWNDDATARVVRVSSVQAGVVSLDDGTAEIELTSPGGVHTDLNTGWYVHVTGWTTATRNAASGSPVKIGAANVREVFPPDTPAIIDRLSGRGPRKSGLFTGRRG